MNNIKVFPNIRFMDFNEDLKCQKIENVVTWIRSGGTPKSDNVEFYSGNISFISIPDMASKYLLSSKKYISELGLKNSSSYIIEKNSILLSAYATIGEVCINKIDVALPQSIFGIKPNENVNTEYFYYLMKKNKSIFKKMQQTGSQPNISLEIVKNIKIWTTPSYEEQTKIANFFTLLDKQIQLIDRKLELYELKKKYYLNNMFCYNDKTKPTLRFREFNSNWIKSKQHLFMNESKEVAKDDINRRITIKLNLNGVYKRETRSIEKESSGTVYLRQKGEFIYGKQNFHKGCFSIIPQELDGFVSSSDLPSFKFNTKIINPVFFLSFWENDKIYQSMESHMTGTGSKRLSPTIFLNYSITIPCVEEQEKIGKLLRSMSEIINRLKEQKSQLLKRKTYYLNNMFV